MADRRNIIVPLLILSFIVFSPDPAARNAAVNQRFDPRPSLEDVIAEEERSLDVLRNSSYGNLNSPYGRILNLTGLEEAKGYAWDSLPKVKERASEQLRSTIGEAGSALLENGVVRGSMPALYSNVTGHVHGTWVRSKVQESIEPPAINLTAYAPEGPFGRLAPRPFGRNITGTEGDVRVRFHERTPYDIPEAMGWSDLNVTGISAEVTIADAETGEEADLQLHGVCFTRLGQIIMTTTSDKLAGIFILPHLALSNATFEPAKAYINESITSTLRRQKDGELVAYNPWPSHVDGQPVGVMDTPDCELILYMQQLPPSQLSAGSLPNTQQSVLAFLEKELRFPTGAFLPHPPEVRFSMLAFSPDCGYILESKGEPDYPATGPNGGEHLVGPKIEELYLRARRHLLICAGVLGLQIWLLKRQMHASSTPSTRSRISFYTIALLALGDGFATMTFLLVSLFIPGLWITLMGTAFLAFVSVSFFGMRFLLDIWTVQAPERARAARAEMEEERAREQHLLATLERLRSEREARLAAVAAGAQQNTTTAIATSDAANAPSPQMTAQQDEGPDMNFATPLNMTRPLVLPTTTTPRPPPPPAPPAVRPPTDAGVTPVFMPSDQEGLTSTADPTDTGNATGPLLPTTNPATPQPPLTDDQITARLPGFGSVYTRFYLLLLGSLFLSLNASGWPSAARRGYFTFLGFCYLSFWVPQIIRNVERNGRKPFAWEFVLGQSFCRLMPFMYFNGYSDNVLLASQDFVSLAILAAWVWVQVLALGSQELFGPRWFVKKDWAPPAYDYHPVLREDEEGATMPIGLSEAAAANESSAPTSPLIERRTSLGSPCDRRSSVSGAVKEKERASRGKGKRVFDCAICFQELEVLVIEADGSTDARLGGGLLGRRQYMVTPCRHIFHSACLEGWMKYRLQCPICRETLPPL